jgi:predicted dehydrogenase
VPGMADADFVIVASPSTRHRDHVTEAIQRGLPVLVEKPLTSGLRDAEHLVTLARRLDAFIQVGYVLRFSDGFKALKDSVLSRGVDGIEHVTMTAHSYLPNWRPGTDFRDGVSARADLGGGVLRELSHELDYAIGVFGPLKILSATLTRSPAISPDVDTGAVIHAVTSSGVKVAISLDMANSAVERSCEIIWRNGERLRWDLTENSLSIHDSSGVNNHRRFTDSRDGWYETQLRAFLRAVVEKSAPSPDIDDGLLVMECIDAIENLAGGQP